MKPASERLAAWTRRHFVRASVHLGAVSLAAGGRVSAQATKSVLKQFKAAEPLRGVDIVDVHGHIEETPADAIWPRGVRPLLEDMDRCGIGQVIFSHLAALGALSSAHLKNAHDESAGAVRQHPGRLKSYLVFHPHQLETSIREMHRALEPNSPFAGFKLHGAFHQYPADGPNYQPVLQFAHEHAIPVLWHVGGASREWIGTVGRLADQFPRMALILAHMGPGEELLPKLLEGRRNLFVDTCGSVYGYRQLERMVSKVGAEKILFATDATYLNTGPQLAKVAFARISEEQKKLILAGNARRVFGGRLMQ